MQKRSNFIARLTRIFVAQLGRRIITTIEEETGSAIVEFVVLALPLFLPIVMFLTATYKSQTINSDLELLARQAARAYISSPDLASEPDRMNAISMAFAQQIFLPEGIAETPTLSVSCSATPCLTPDARVEVTATLVEPAASFGGFLRFLPTNAQTYSASDTQIVDAWR